MNGSLKSCASAIALFGSLGFSTTSGAVAVVCDLSMQSGRSSTVASTVTPGTPNDFAFSICNTSNDEVRHLLRDWELPYDSAGQITNLRAPTGWAVTTETIGQANDFTGWDGLAPTWFATGDPFYDPRYLGLTEVIHFYTCDGLVESSCYGAFGAALAPGEGLDGFGFNSPFPETNAPYQASWTRERPRSGDPAFPLAGGPNTPGLLALPEPGGLALFAMALGALLGARGARKKSEAT